VSALSERERLFAERADIKLEVERVDTGDRDTVRACLLRCVAGRLLWRAWKMRAAMRGATPRQRRGRADA